MKKIVVRVMSFIMMLSMMALATGCASEKDKFIGTWESSVNMAEFFNEGLGDDEEMLEYLKVDEFSLVLEVTFNSDGTYKISANETAAKEAFSKLKDDLKVGMQKYFEDMITAQGLGMTVDEVLALSGTSLDAVMEEALGDEVLDEMISEMTSEGNFEVEDGKLYLSDGVDYAVDKNVYDTYEINGDELKLIESFGSDDEDGFNALYPLVFTRK